MYGINAETRPPVLRTGKTHCGRVKFLNSYVSRSPLRRTVESDLHIMLSSYYIGMCVFHERQRDMTSVKVVKHKCVFSFRNKNWVFNGKEGKDFRSLISCVFPCAKALRSYNELAFGFSCSWGSRGAL